MCVDSEHRQEEKGPGGEGLLRARDECKPYTCAGGVRDGDTSRGTESGVRVHDRLH